MQQHAEPIDGSQILRGRGREEGSLERNIDDVRNGGVARRPGQIEGKRWEALRYYGGAVIAGDLRSVGRGAVALVRPQPTRTAEPTEWAARARSWLDALVRSEGDVPFNSS